MRTARIGNRTLETLVKPWSHDMSLGAAFSRRAAQADRRRWYEAKALVVLHAPPRQTFPVASIIKELRPLCRAAGLYPGLSTGHGGRQLEPRLYLKRAAPSPSPTCGRYPGGGSWKCHPSCCGERNRCWPAPGLMGPFDSPYKPPARAGAPGWIVNKPHTHTEVGSVFALYICTMPPNPRAADCTV